MEMRWNAVISFARLLRVREWLDSKVTLHLFSALFLIWSGNDADRLEQFVNVHFYILFAAVYLGVNYLINDLADYDVDLAAGKKKEIQKIHKRTAVLLMLVCMLVGIGPVLWRERSIGILVAVAVIYFFGFSYSVRPFRFKERGFMGAVISSFAQRCVPLLVVLSFVRADVPAAVIIILLNFFVGMRYILLHQLVDLRNDRMTGTSTFSTKHPKLAKGLMYWNLAIEGVLIAGMLFYMLGKGGPNIAAAFLALSVLYGILLLVYIKAVRYMLGENIFETFSFVPFEDYYSIILPLALCICLGIGNLFWLADIPLILLLQFRMICVRIGFLRQYFKAIRSNKVGGVM